MKKTLIIEILSFTVIGLIGFLIFDLIQTDSSGLFSGAFRLPSGFPTRNGLMLIWSFLLLLATISTVFILTNKISINRKKNALIILLMLLGSIYGWNFLLFTTQGNLSGALAMNIGEIALAGLTMLMFWLINHKAGYLLFPTFIWALFSLYLSISLVVLN